MTSLTEFDVETLEEANRLFRRPCIFLKGVAP